MEQKPREMLSTTWAERSSSFQGEMLVEVVLLGFCSSEAHYCCVVALQVSAIPLKPKSPQEMPLTHTQVFFCKVSPPNFSAPQRGVSPNLKAPLASAHRTPGVNDSSWKESHKQLLSSKYHLDQRWWPITGIRKGVVMVSSRFPGKDKIMKRSRQVEDESEQERN